MRRNKLTRTIFLGAPILGVFHVAAANADMIKGDFNQAGPGWAAGVAVSATSAVPANGIMYAPRGAEQLEQTPIIPRQTDAEDSLK